MKGSPEICRIAKAERKSDLFIRQIRAAKIFERNLSS
jgi:hypothetical protein